MEYQIWLQHKAERYFSLIVNSNKYWVWNRQKRKLERDSRYQFLFADSNYILYFSEV